MISTCFVCWLFIISCESAIIDKLSFKKPFDHISADGIRQVSANWQQGGSTMVNKHFIRLTPDRQSKRGYIWSTDTIGRDEFSAILTFRVSGQGKRWFGDGLALWITSSPTNHVDGENHGFTDRYTGVGVVFDTFENEEHPGGHKDVSIYVNDGRLSLDDMMERPKEGCDVSGLRYHEKNALFSPALNVSRAKVQLKDNLFQIMMDAENSGAWTECFVTKLSLPRGWSSGATIGLTGTTGALADNHDVLELSVFDTVEDSKHIELDEKTRKKQENPRDVNLMDNNELEKVKELQKQYEKMHEDFEHQFAALKEQTETTIAKLREQEEKDMQRIVELEHLVNGKVNDQVSRQMNDFSASVDQKLEKKVAETVTKQTSWKTPFSLLILGIVGAAAFIYKKYQDLRKSHLL